MKLLIYLIPVLFLLSPALLTEQNEFNGQQLSVERAAADTVDSHPGRVLIEQNCYSCHTPEMTGQKRLAPPIQMVKMHYIRDYETKEMFVDAISEWVNQPAKEKSIMPGALNRFGLMAPVAISDEDVRLIAEYLYEADLPAIKDHGNGHMMNGRQEGTKCQSLELDCSVPVRYSAKCPF